MPTLLTLLIILFLIVLVIRIFKKPVRFFFKLLFNTALGYVLLIIINHFGQYVGISLHIDPLSSLIVGFLGIPGLIILLVFQK